MERRNFIRESSLALIGLLAYHENETLFEFEFYESQKNNELRKFIINEYALYRSSFQQDQLDDNLNTMFWLTLDPGGTMSSREKRNALNSTMVSLEDLYKACNFKINTIDDSIATAFEWTVGVGALALGIVSPPAAIGAIGLFALEKSLTLPIDISLETKREAQIYMCQKTVEKFFIAESNIKQFLKKEATEAKTLIDFRSSNKQILEKLPKTSNIAVAKALLENKEEETDDFKNKELVNKLLQKQQEELELKIKSIDDFVTRISTTYEKEGNARWLEFEYKERQAAIYLSQQLFSRIFRPEIANEYATVANAMNDIYYTYEKFGIGQNLTFGATANYISAGLVIANVLQGNDSTNVYKEIFKAFKRLTALIIDGFSSIQSGQREILKQIRQLTENVDNWGYELQTAINVIDVKLSGFRNDYKEDRFTSTQKVLSDTIAILNSRFRDEHFSLVDLHSKDKFLDALVIFQIYGTTTASLDRILSGYMSDYSSIEDEINKFEREKSFEYLFGILPVIHRKIFTTVSVFLPSEFETKIPNPIEWCRGFYLYYKYVFASGLFTSERIRFGMSEFLEKGILIRSFCNKYSSTEFISILVKKHYLLSRQLISIINDSFNKFIHNSDYYLYQYLISTISNEVYKENISFNYFLTNHNPATETFFHQKTEDIRRDIHGVYGVRVPFNLSKTLMIMADREIIDRLVFKTITIPGPAIPFEISTAKLRFKGSKASIQIMISDPNRNTWKSHLVVGSSESDIGDIWTGKATADFQRVLKSVEIPDSYWKVRPSKAESLNKITKEDIGFLDFFRNEIIHFEFGKRNKLVDDFIIRENSILQSNRALVDDLNNIGYLLSASLTLLKYKNQKSASNSYLLKREFGVDNSCKPFKPELAFAKDVFAQYVKYLGRDCYNDFLKYQTSLPSIDAYKASISHDLYKIPSQEELAIAQYDISLFALNSVMIRLDNQRDHIIEMMKFNNDACNYNVEKIINEVELYLKKTK